MKKLNATFDIENDLAEYTLRNTLEGMGAKYVKTMADTEHLKNQPNYKNLVKAKKDAESKLYEYINNNRI